jgi:hypothetical protein
MLALGTTFEASTVPGAPPATVRISTVRSPVSDPLAVPFRALKVTEFSNKQPLPSTVKVWEAQLAAWIRLLLASDVAVSTVTAVLAPTFDPAGHEGWDQAGVASVASRSANAPKTLPELDRWYETGDILIII